ncbi:MAG: T9SS type A sorting domain-containing protein [bacterium]|nr:T9SS type A sorting domain-containing protein [bacterium]
MKKLTTSILVALLAMGNALAQSPTQNKTGGICFRVDDHQGASKWRDWNKLFNKYGLKFSLAINASRLYYDTAAVNALREIAAAGHELMDHTPDHHMAFFSVKVASDANAYANNAAVDHINGTKVCLKVDAPNYNSYINEGNVNLVGNKLISVNNGEFAGINGNPYYALIYLPSKNKYAVYTSVQNKNTSNPDTLVLQTYWQETWANDTAYNISYHRITTADVKSIATANLLLAQRSKDLFALYGLPEPKTWIQPGGSYALLNRFEVENFATQVGYKTGAVNILSAQKCYKEVDSFNNRRYSLQGPDFYEESNNFQGLANIISDRSARHYNSFGLSHMTNVQGGWNTFITRVDSLLNWANLNQIPVRTYEQWGQILFDSTANRAANIIPAINKDLNNNNFPDGYNTNALLVQTDGIAASGYKCFASANNNASLASISNLGGLEKGDNLVTLFTKGMLGDSIRMVITYPEMALPTQMIMFAANTSEWTEQKKIVQIPAHITRVNVSWIVIKRTNPGTVKMCGMEMRKSAVPQLYKGYLQQQKSTQNFESISLENWASDGYFSKAQLSFGLNQGGLFNMAYNAETRALQLSSLRAFATGKDSVKVWVSNPDGLSDTAYFVFEKIAHSINVGDTLRTAISLGFTPDSSTWKSTPLDATIQVNYPNFSAAPQTQTWYKMNAWQSGQLQIDSFMIATVGGYTPIDTISNEDNPLDTQTTTPAEIASGNFTHKVGGICFRIDDYQTADKLRALNTTFAKYGRRFTLGINAGKLIGDTAAVNALREIAAAGHELADHTADHQLNFYNVTKVQDTLVLQGHPGIDHFNGKKVCLKIDTVITVNYINEGLVQTNGNLLISQANGEWKTMGSPVYYSNIYLPSFDKVFTYSNLLNKNANDPDTMTLISYWGEGVNLGIASNLTHHRLTQYDIKQSANGLALLTQRTFDLLDSFNLPRPKTFLQPSGNYAMLNRTEVRDFFGANYGYTAGGVYVQTAWKCYNEVDDNGDKRFGIHGPDFREENTTAASIISTLADNSAKHHTSFGLSMMSNMTGGLAAYVARIDTILSWCLYNDIPVLTFNKWANILYDSVPNPFVNVIPLLQKDLNKNAIPDGYTGPFAGFDTLDGVAFSNNRSYFKGSNGTLTAITNLGGIEKGNNTFYISTKGFTSDSVRVTFNYPEINSSYVWMAAASTTDWAQQSTTIHIPANVSRVNITFAAVKRNVLGNIKISGMQLFAAPLLKTNSVVAAPVQEFRVEPTTDVELLVYPNPSRDKAYLMGALVETVTKIEIMDALGNLSTLNWTVEGGKISFDLSAIAQGLLLVRVTDEQKKVHQMKLIKL